MPRNRMSARVARPAALNLPHLLLITRSTSRSVIATLQRHWHICDCKNRTRGRLGPMSVRVLFLKDAGLRIAGLPREVTRAYHNRKRHEIRLAARALVADADGEPGDGCQRGFLSSRSTSALVKPMSWSMWSSSSASTRRCTERARLEVIMRFPMSLHDGPTVVSRFL